MDLHPSSLQPLHSINTVSTVEPNTEMPLPHSILPKKTHHGNAIIADPTLNLLNPTVQIPSQSSKPMNDNVKVSNNRNKKKKKKKKAPLDGSVLESSSCSVLESSSCSSICSSCSSQGGMSLANKRQNHTFLVGLNRLGESDVEAIALPLGISIAAVMAQVLERGAEERISVDHLSMICTLAIRESLANVFGDKFDCFAENFEKSFRSTLRTLRLINESSMNRRKHHSSHQSVESSASDVSPLTSLNNETGSMSSCIKSHSEAVSLTAGTQDQLSTLELVQENVQTDSMNRELALHGQIDQQLACAAPSTLGSVLSQSVLSTVQKSVLEQTRANDLKTFEISLLMKRLQLEETKLALDTDSNILERLKLSMGFSKSSFKAEKFKNQLEDTRHAELLKKCIDCLVAGLLIMSASLAYGAYVHSYGRIIEATASCTAPKESHSWWILKPMASFSSGLYIISCQVQVVSRMLFGLLIILAIAYLLLQRSATSQQTMPVTSILLILGFACGFAGKLCVDTLGGSGYHWLLYWEAFCLLHFFSNVCTSALFLILHGPVNVSQGEKGNIIFPYWARRLLFYVIMLLFLPLFCGLMPFANPGEWKDHFSLKVSDFLTGT